MNKEYKETAQVLETVMGLDAIEEPLLEGLFVDNEIHATVHVDYPCVAYD